MKRADQGSVFALEEVVAPAPEEGLQPPLSRAEYLSSLPEVKRNLLEAARRLFVQSGFPALKLDAIASEAAENKAMIRYYFGDKAGLVGALVDDLTHDATVALVARCSALPGDDERVHAHLLGARRMMEDPQFPSLFDVLPHAFRDEELRTRIADLYDWYRDVNVRCLGPQLGSASRDRLLALASIFMATVDGLAIQAALDPEHFDLAPAFTMLESMIKSTLADIQAAEAGGMQEQPVRAGARTKRAAAVPAGGRRAHVKES